MSADWEIDLIMSVFKTSSLLPKFALAFGK